MSALAWRVLGWFILVAVGNLGVLGVVYMVAQKPLSFPWHETVANIAAYAQQLFSPTLLFFTAVLGIVTSLYPGSRAKDAAVEEDTEHAERLIARAVQLSLAIVLSFAVVVTIDDPAQIANVLFAILLSFIAFALAESVAPPQRLSLEQEYRRARELSDRASRWASGALGAGWRQAPTRGFVWIIVALLAIPVLVPFFLAVGITAILAGAEIALDPRTLWAYALSMIGALPFTLAWLTATDKADSPRSRLWRSIFLHLLALAMVVLLSLVYFLGGGPLWWVGLAVIGSGALAVALAYAPRPAILVEARRRVERRVTLPSLTRQEKAAAAAERTWLASVPPRRNPVSEALRRLLH